MQINYEKIVYINGDVKEDPAEGLGKWEILIFFLQVYCIQVKYLSIFVSKMNEMRGKKSKSGQT